MAGGRPEEYEDTYPEMLIEHFKQGYSFESFGGVVGVCKQTLYKWCEAHPEFMDAKQKGKMHSLLVWEKKGIDGLYNETIKDDDGMTINRSINAVVWKVNMFNRFGWGEKNTVEISGPEGKPIETKNVSEIPDEQLDEKIKAYLSRQGNTDEST